jgi:hypothetical protein
VARYKTGRTTASREVLKSQHEFARSISRSYREGGAREVNATGMDERIMTTFNGNPSSIPP